MTREEAKELLPFIQAFAEGKTIEVLHPNGGWTESDKVYFNLPSNHYHIKKESKYRPFKSQEECWNEMMKHQPFGWIRNKVNRAIIHISFALGGYVMLATENRGFSDVFDKFEFIDGTPFGIKKIEL